jgi:F-type H+-transporting ATPase subunit b
MRRTMISGLLALGTLLVLGCGPSAEKKATGPNGFKYEHHKDGKAVEAEVDAANPDDLKEFAEHLKKGEVEDIDFHKPPNFLSPVWDLGLWTLVVFLALLFILSKVAWKPMLEGLKSREDNIAKAMTEAEAARREAAEMRSKFDAEFKKAQEQAREIIADASRNGQRAADDIITKAKAEMAAESERGRRELETAKDQALKELFEYTANLATQVSSKAVRRQLNEDDHRRLVDEALAEMPAAMGRFSAN